MTTLRSPKVLHVITGLQTGGAERSLVNLLTHPSDRGQASHVISLSSEGYYGPLLKERGIGVSALKMSSFPQLISSCMRLRRIIRAFDPDLIQGWMYHGSLMASLGAKLSGRSVPVAWNIRQSLYDPHSEKTITRWIIRALAQSSAQPAAIIYNSRQARTHHEAYGFCADNGVVIANGFDTDRWRPNNSTRAVFREALGVGDAPVAGYVGRNHPQKDVPTFLAAAAMALKIDPELHVVMVGEGLERDQLRSSGLAGELPANRFHALGRRNDIECILPGMDFLCLSSSSESFPNVLGEAMATGLPCVATDVGDCADLIDEYGLIVPAGDPSSLGQAMVDMAKLSKTHCRQIGLGGRNRIIEKYSMQVTVDSYSKIYNSLCSRDK